MSKKRDPAARQTMPEAVKDNQCKARTKRCRNCDHRYVKGDKSWYCPTCGEPRRCINAAVTGYPVCRSHGAHKKRKVSAKYLIASQISASFHRILADPDILNLTNEMAMVGARLEQLQARLEALDPIYNHGEVAAAIDKMEKALEADDRPAMWKAIMRIKDASDPIRVEGHIWSDIKDTLALLRSMQDTERRWLTANKQMVPIAQVLELIVYFQRLMFRYVTSSNDRQAIADEIRSLLPKDSRPIS